MKRGSAHAPLLTGGGIGFRFGVTLCLALAAVALLVFPQPGSVLAVGAPEASLSASPAAGFLAFQTVGPPGAGVISSTALGVDQRGTATIVWNDEAIYPRARIHAATVSASSRVSGAVSLPGGNLQSTVPSVAVAASGATAATWANSKDATVRAAVRPAGRRSWQAASLRVSPAQLLSDPAVAVNGAGDVLVAFVAVPLHGAAGQLPRVLVAYRPAGGTFSAPTVASPPGEAVDRLGVGSNVAASLSDGGGAVLVWSAVRGSSHVLETASGPAGGALTSTQTVLASPDPVSPPSLAATSAGRAIATWTVGAPYTPPYPEPLGPAPTKDVRVYAASREPGRPFSAPVQLSSSGTETRGAMAATDSRGDVMIAWSTVTQRTIVDGYKGSTDSATRTRLDAAFQPAGGQWSPAQPLSSPAIEPGTPAIAITPDRQALALWSENLGPQVTSAPSKLRLHATRRTPAGALIADQLLSAGPRASPTSVNLAVAAAGNAVAAWTDHNGIDVSQGSGLGGPLHPNIAPKLDLTNGRYTHGALRALVRCAERCRFTATLSRSGGKIDHPITRRLGQVRRPLPGNRTASLRLADRAVLCPAGARHPAIVVRLNATGTHTHTSRTVVRKTIVSCTVA